jgi:hypothetical protein
MHAVGTSPRLCQGEKLIISYPRFPVAETYMKLGIQGSARHILPIPWLFDLQCFLNLGIKVETVPARGAFILDHRKFTHHGIELRCRVTIR